MDLIRMLVVFGAFLYVAQSQGLLGSLPGPVNKANKEIKQTEKDKADLEHVIPIKKTMYIADFPKRKSNSEKNIVLNATLPKQTNNSQAMNHNVTSHQIVSSSNGSLQKVDQTLEEKTDELTSGAITRGIMVFMALSFLFILYVGIKTYRRKSQDKRHTMVKKYGVRTRRSDIEMEPLPLSDEEDDETVFDLTTSRGYKS